MIFLPKAAAGNFTFFDRTEKVLPVGTNTLSKKKGYPYPEIKFLNFGSQKKELQCKPQYLKSLIFKEFEDYIFNIAIRINLSFILFIFLVESESQGPRGGVWGPKIKVLTGNR